MKLPPPNKINQNYDNTPLSISLTKKPYQKWYTSGIQNLKKITVHY